VAVVGLTQVNSPRSGHGGGVFGIARRVPAPSFEQMRVAAGLVLLGALELSAAGVPVPCNFLCHRGPWATGRGVGRVGVYRGTHEPYALPLGLCLWRLGVHPHRPTRLFEQVAGHLVCGELRPL
jgi:hypothetical protein